MEKEEIAVRNDRLRRHMFALADREFWEKNDRLIGESIEKIGGEGLEGIRTVYLTGHGTSFATAENGQSIMSRIAGVYTRALYAYELWRYPEEFLIEPGRTLVIGITCGGNTESVRLALKESRQRGARTMLISHDGECSCSEEAQFRIRTDCRVEECADVQAYTVSHLFLLTAVFKTALLLASKNGTADRNSIESWEEKFEDVRKKMDCIPQLFEKMRLLALWYKESGAENFAVLGAGPNRGTMVEGALKICEMAWKFGAGEELEDFAHGRFREMDGTIPLLILSPSERTKDKVMDILAGCKIAGVPAIVFTQEADAAMRKMAKQVVLMPRIEDEYMTPFLYVLPLWFFGFHIRNLENEMVGEKRFGLFARDIDFKAHFDQQGERIS